MISSFGDKKTKDIFEGKAPKGFPVELVTRSRRLLERIHSAHDVNDLRFPPSHRLHKLDGDLKGFWSISVNMQYRIIFRFSGHDAKDVKFLDYH